MEKNNKDNSKKIWDNTSYRWWFGADSSYQLSSSIVHFVIPLLIIQSTGSTGFATTLSSLFILVSTIVGIAGGVIQDRYERKRLMILNGAISFLILVTTGSIIYFFGLKAKVVLVLSILLALQEGFLGNTSNVILRSIVSSEQLPKAMSANNARDTGMNILGGPLGGFLMGIGSSLTLIVGSILCLASSLFTCGISKYWKNDTDVDTDSGKTKYRTAFMGFWWIIANSFQRRFLLTAACAAASANAFLLLTVLEIAKNTSNNAMAGMVNTVAALGMLCGAIAATWLINRIRSGVLVALMFLNLTAGFILATLIPNLWIKLIFIPISLFFLPAGSAVLGSFFNLLVRQENLGRFFAGCDLVTYLTLSIFTFGAGWIMEMWGYAVANLVIAILLGVVAISALTLKPLIMMPEPKDWEEHIKKYNISQL